MPLLLQPGIKAMLWRLLSGSALVIGAAHGYFLKIPSRIIACVMAFGSGVLISALSFDLMDEAYKQRGAVPTSIGFICGAIIYSIATYILNYKGGKHRKRSDLQLADEKSSPAVESQLLSVRW